MGIRGCAESIRRARGVVMFISLKSVGYKHTLLVLVTVAGCNALLDINEGEPLDESSSSSSSSSSSGANSICGDGIVSPGEECDDGGMEDGNYCSPTCKEQRVLGVSAGFSSTCAKLSGNRIKCWGAGVDGQLGQGNMTNLGDGPGEMGNALPAVELGADVENVVTVLHTCAILKTGLLKCWASNVYGQLGLDDADARGDNPDEMGTNLPEVSSIGAVTAVALGGNTTCALLEGGIVKCWGRNENGQLGLGHTMSMGDDMGEMASLTGIELGDAATAIAVGSFHACAILSSGDVKCWGGNYVSQLGLGDLNDRGNEPGEMAVLPKVDLGMGKKAKAIAAGGIHTCVILAADSKVKCWGYNNQGQLGLGDTIARGGAPGTMGDALPNVDLGTNKLAVAISARGGTTCVLLNDSTVKCWGTNANGQVGLGDNKDAKLYIGDAPNEMGDNLPAIGFGMGKTPTGIAVGQLHACAIFSDNSIKCWGSNAGGQLGLGDITGNNLNIGDGPDEMGDKLPTVKLFSNAW
jgi:cysteine-rich repeat protein